MTKSNQPIIQTPGLHFANPALSQEMQAYDTLPPILREALRLAPIDLDATQCLNEYLQNPKNAAALAQEIGEHLITVLNKERMKSGLPPIASLK